MSSKTTSALIVATFQSENARFGRRKMGIAMNSDMNSGRKLPLVGKMQNTKSLGGETIIFKVGWQSAKHGIVR